MPDIVLSKSTAKAWELESPLLHQLSDSQITLYKGLAFKGLLFTAVLIIGDDANSWGCVSRLYMGISYNGSTTLFQSVRGGSVPLIPSTCLTS